MRNRLLAVIVLMACSCFAAMAQGRNSIVKYVTENNLYRSGNDVTITNIDVEWPASLDGNGMPALQKVLCKELLGVSATTMEEGWREFHASLGTRINHMPDSVVRHYVYVKLERLWQENGRYASFYLKRQEVGQDGVQKAELKKFITYDIANDKVLNLDDIFSEYVDENNRVAFEALLDQGAYCDAYDRQMIDLTTLPADFAVMGNAGLINLGGPYDHDDFATVSLNNLYQIGLLKHGFVKWLEGKTKSKPKKKESVLAPANFDASLAGDSIVYNINAAPSFPGGQDSLIAFIKSNITYPTVDMAMKHQGRVTLSFVVEADGSLSDITVVEPLSPGLDREAVRVVRLMPKLRPGERNGVNVRTRMTLPIYFRLSNNS